MKLTCKEATLLASKAMDARLTVRERLAVRVHLMYCRGCTRFREQIQFLRRMARRSSDRSMAGAVHLSSAARDRIRAVLQRDR